MKLLYVKCSEKAVTPFKQRNEDSGYDLTIIEKIDQIGSVELYDTKIKLKPPDGWYLDLVPRSSIIKTGYILANSVGVIDSTYTGTILVPLLKVNKEAPDLVLPARIVQVVPRPLRHFSLEEVQELELTERGGKGFGSTNQQEKNSWKLLIA